MELQEYKNLLEALEKKHRLEMNGLHIQFANENNPHKVGDIISDHSITIKIQKISVSFGSQRIPQCVYDGVVLKKDGTPNVRGKTDTVYQSNIRVTEAQH